MFQRPMQQGPRVAAEHGQYVFIYGHVRTNQVIYSLTRTLDNNSGLKQLPFLGKKTKPAVIRKDFWRPLATVMFPSGAQGLSAYQKLREFRKRHELEWDLGPIRQLARKKRGRLLQDQKANSVADLAAVLEGQAKIASEEAERFKKEQIEKDTAREKVERRSKEVVALRAEAKKAFIAAPNEETKEKYKQYKNELMKLKTQSRTLEPDVPTVNQSRPHKDRRTTAQAGFRSMQSEQQAVGITMDGVKIEWANILDAELARTWPQAVIHDTLGRGGIRTRHIPTSSLGQPGTSQEMGAKTEERKMTPSTLQPATSQAQEVTVEPPSRLQSLVDRLRFGRLS